MKRLMFVALALIFLGPVAAAQETSPPGTMASRSGYFGVGLSGGYMMDPDMTSGMVSLDYYVTDEISVGPYFYGGGGEDDSFWGVAGQVKFSAPLASTPQVRPFAFAGIGFAELDFEHRKDDPERTYLFPVGGGMEFEINDVLTLEGTGVYHLTEDVFTGIMVGVRIIL
ncbi:MAG: hypothetical protein R6V10_16965 [bacterium]